MKILKETQKLMFFIKGQFILILHIHIIGILLAKLQLWFRKIMGIFTLRNFTLGACIDYKAR